MILLRRNNQVDDSFSVSRDIPCGTIVSLVCVERFKSDLATVRYILPTNHKDNYGNYEWPGNINCFDYVKQVQK